MASASDTDDKEYPVSSFANPGQYSQGKTKNLLIFLTLSLITLTHAFESTCLCVTLPIVAEDLGATLSQTLSFSTIFLLGMTLAQPVSSEIAFVTGRRPAFLLAVAVFIIGTIMCGLADTPFYLLLGRAVQGVGAGATEPIKALILYDIFALRERSKWVSFLNVAWAIGTVSGPLLGGKFTDENSIGWRWVFWLNLPFLGVSFVGAAWLLNYNNRPCFSWGLVKRVDWGGLVLFLGSGAAFLIALTGGGSRLPWSSAKIITPLIVGLAGFVGLGCYETWFVPKPIFRPSVLRRRSTVIQLTNVAIHGLLMWMILYYMSLYFLGVKNYSPFTTGLWSLPATLTVAPMAIIVGQIVFTTGHYRYFLLGGWVMTVISFGILQLVDEDMPDAALIVVAIVGGISFGMLVPGMGVGIQSTVEQEDAGYAISLTLLMRPAGQCLGIAVGQAIFSTRLNKILVGEGFPEGFGQDLMGYVRRGLDANRPDMDPMTARHIPAIIDAIIQALRSVWIAGAALSGLALILTCCAKCPRLPDDRLRGYKPPSGDAEVGKADIVLQDVNTGKKLVVNVGVSPRQSTRFTVGAAPRPSQDVAAWSGGLREALSRVGVRDS